MSASAPHPRAAFTLIELLFATVAATILGATLIVSMLGSFDAFATITAQSILQTQNLRALDRIAQDTKEARQALTNYSVYAMDTKGGGSDGDAYWILQAPAINAAGETINASDSNFQDHIVYRYDSASKQLRRLVFRSSGSARASVPAPGAIIATDIQEIEFKIPPPLSTQTEMRKKMVDIWIRCTTTQRGRTYELSMTKQAVYRHPAPP